MAAGREAALKIMLEMEGNVEQKTKEVASSLDNLSQAGKVAAGVFGGNLLTGAFNALRNMATQAIGAVKQQFSEMVNMAGEEQVGIARLGQAVKATGANWAEAQRGIEAYLASEGKRIALDDGAGRASLAQLTTMTGDYKKAMDLLPIAADLARGKQIDLSTASMLVGRVASGNTEILKRYGIELKEGATSSEALAELQSRYAGQAEAYASTWQGTQAQISTTVGNIKETIGGALLPTLTDVGKTLNDALNRPEVRQSIEDIAAAIGDMARQVGEVAALFLKGDIEGGLAKITDPQTAHGLIVIADALGKMRDALADLSGKAGGAQAVGQSLKEANPFSTGEMVRGVGEVSTGLDNLKTIMAGVKSGSVDMGQGMGAALAVMFGVGDAGANAMQKVTTAMQGAQGATSAYSYTVSDSSIVARALANEAKYGADNVQVLAMNMDAARAAAESFNTGIAANAAAVQTLAASAQQSGQIMATAFSSEAVQSSMAAFQNTVMQFQQQQLQQEQQAALAMEQAQVARNAQLLMSEAQYQQQRASQVAQGEAQIAALQAAGQAQKAAAKQADLTADLAQSDAKRQQSVALEEAQYQQQQQIQERALLVQRVQALQAYQQQLQDQQDATLRALALSVQEATQKAGLEAASQKAMLEMIYGAGSAALQAEYGFAQDRLSIEKDLAEGRLTSAEAQIKAILAVQNAEKGNAAAALEQAKSALAGFKIEAPKLPAIDTTQFAASVPAAASAGAAAGSAASKPMTEKFSSVLGDVNQGIDLAEQALIKLLSFSLPEGWKDGVAQLREFATTMVSTLQNVTAKLTLTQMKTAKELGSALSKVVGSFTQFAQLGQLLKGEPISDAEIMAWLDQYKRVMTYIATAVVDLETYFGGYDRTKEIYKSAKRFKTMLDSTLIELSAVKVVQLPDLNVWKNQIMSVITAAFETVTAIRDRIGATNLKRAAADVSVLKSLIELTGSDLAAMKLGVLPDLKAWGDQFVAVIGAAVTAINRANVEIGSLQIKGAADVGPKLKTILDSVSGGFDALKPAELKAGETFAARVDTYFAQAKYAFSVMVVWLYDLYSSAQAMVGQAAEIAGPVGTVFGLTVDLEKFVPADSGFEQRAMAYVGNLRFLGGLLVAWLSEIKGDAVSWVTQAAGISEYVKKLFDLVGIDLAGVVPQGEGFQEKAVAYIAQLRWFGGKLYGWMNEIVQAGVSEAVKLAAEVSGYVATLFGLIGPDLSKLVPQDADYQTRALAYIAQLKWTGGQIFGWLRDIKGTLADEVKQAGDIAGAVKSLFDLLGINLSSLVPMGSNFPVLLTAFLNGLAYATDRLVPWLRNIRDRYTGEVLTEAKDTADAVKAIIDLLGLSDTFSKIADLSKVNVVTLVTRMADKLQQAVDLLVPALQTIGDKWGGALDAVKATAESIKAVFTGIYDIAKAIDDAAQLGGIDVGTAQALINQFARLGMLTLPDMTGYGAPVAPTGGADIAPTPSGADTAQARLETAVSQLAAAVAALSNEGVMITLHGYSDDGAEGEYSTRIKRGQNVSIDMRSWAAAKSG